MPPCLRCPIATKSALQSSARPGDSTLSPDSLGVFHKQSDRLLASFAGNISGGNRVVCYGHSKNAWFPHPHCPLKAGYTAHSTGFRSSFKHICVHDFTHRNTGSRLIRTDSAAGGLTHPDTVPHKNRSPRKQGRVPHAIGDRPENASTASWARRASPQHPPQTGRPKQAQGVSTICPLKDF